MIEIKAPHGYAAHKNKRSVFLAGSIEMGAAENWQEEIVRALRDKDVLLLNPRRDAWDAGWAQTIDNPLFREQVEWELQALEDADLIVMYFSPATKSPVTLLELGVHAAKNPEKIVVCCPDGFWRKGNVDIVCRRYGVRAVATLKELINAI